jgi:hypothetical protein
METMPSRQLRVPVAWASDVADSCRENNTAKNRYPTLFMAILLTGKTPPKIRSLY